MNSTQMNAIRDKAECTFSSGDFAIVAGTHVLAMNLHRDRAEEWAAFYKGAKVVPMAEVLPPVAAPIEPAKKAVDYDGPTIYED